MKTIDINLAGKPFRNNILFYLFHSVLICLVILATTLNIYFFVHFKTFEKNLNDKVVNSQMNIKQLDQKGKRILEMISKKDLKSIIKKADFANNAIVMRKFSWTGLFNDLERVLPYEVRMQSIRPSVKDKGIEVRVDGLTKDLKSFLEFERNLQEDNNFDRVRPENQRKMQSGEISFSLLFEYHPQEWSIEEIYIERESLAEDLEEEEQSGSPIQDQVDISQDSELPRGKSQG